MLSAQQKTYKALILTILNDQEKRPRGTRTGALIQSPTTGVLLMKFTEEEGLPASKQGGKLM